MEKSNTYSQRELKAAAALANLQDTIVTEATVRTGKNETYESTIKAVDDLGHAFTPADKSVAEADKVFKISPSYMFPAALRAIIDKKRFVNATAAVVYLQSVTQKFETALESFDQE